jgi:tRNA 2-selenouridine synthase SelU
MTDENNQEQNNTESNETFSKSQLEELVAKAVSEEKNKLRSSFGDQMKEALEKQKIEAAEAARQKKLEEQQEYKTLLEEQKTNFATRETEMENKIKSLEAKNVEALQDSILAKNGITDEVIVRGLKGIYSDMSEAPDFSQWVSEQAGKLSKATTGRSSGSVGSVSQTTSNASVDERMQSSDPAVRRLAAIEKGRMLSS